MYSLLNSAMKFEILSLLFETTKIVKESNLRLSSWQGSSLQPAASDLSGTEESNIELTERQRSYRSNILLIFSLDTP